MGYFPFFIDISMKKGLIVGGGTVAYRKVQKLMPYGPELTVAAPELCLQMEELVEKGQVRCRRTEFDAHMLEGAFFVVAATDDSGVNHMVSKLCIHQNIPVNVVDDPEACTFLFPSLVKRGSLSVGISTAGASPSAAIYVKKKIEEELPEHMEEILDYLGAVREQIRQSIPEERKRAACFAELFRACLRQDGALDRESYERIVKEALANGGTE